MRTIKWYMGLLSLTFLLSGALTSCGGDDDEVPPKDTNGNQNTSGIPFSTELQYDEWFGMSYREFRIVYTYPDKPKSTIIYNIYQTEKSKPQATYNNYESQMDRSSNYVFRIENYMWIKQYDGEDKLVYDGKSQSTSFWNFKFDADYFYTGSVIKDFDEEHSEVGWYGDAAFYNPKKNVKAYYHSGNVKVLYVDKEVIKLEFDRFTIKTENETSEFTGIIEFRVLEYVM